MPELPEVETVVRGLGKHLPGQKIKDVGTTPWRNIKAGKSLLFHPGFKASAALGRKIVSLERRGKGIIINLEKGLSLLIHLKMTGQLIYMAKGERLNFGHPDNNFLATMPSNHTRVIFELTKGTLYFNDQRLFGWVKLLPTEEIANDSFIKKLGPEPLSPKFTPAVLWATIQRRPKATIKSIIMDQAVVTGVGNIYADEALFASRIRPTRLGKNVTRPEATKLVAEIKKVLTLGIKHSGTSLSHYKTGEGATGKMQNHLKVYGRKDQHCPTCASPINKIRVAGRGTHYCPTCQS